MGATHQCPPPSPVSAPTAPRLGWHRLPTACRSGRAGDGRPPPRLARPPPLPHTATTLKRCQPPTTPPFLSASFSPTSEYAKVLTDFEAGIITTAFSQRAGISRLPFTNQGRTVTSPLPWRLPWTPKVHRNHLSSPPHRNDTTEAASATPPSVRVHPPLHVWCAPGSPSILVPLTRTASTVRPSSAAAPPLAPATR
jgi:hypothetical protein